MLKILAFLTSISALDLAIGNVDYTAQGYGVAEHFGGHHYIPKPHNYNINIHQRKIKPGKMKKHKKQHVVYNNYYSYPKYDYHTYTYPTYVNNLPMYEQPSYHQYPKNYMNEGFGHPNYQKYLKNDDYQGHIDKDGTVGPKSYQDVYSYQKKDSDDYYHHKDINTYIDDHFVEPSHQNIDSKDDFSYPKVPQRGSYTPQKEAASKGHTYTQHHPSAVISLDDYRNEYPSYLYDRHEVPAGEFEYPEASFDPTTHGKHGCMYSYTSPQQTYRYEQLNDDAAYSNPSNCNENYSIHHSDILYVHGSDHDDLYTNEKLRLCEKVCQSRNEKCTNYY